jgi:pimeloyl-ACP methyl ester carboxylesterase
MTKTLFLPSAAGSAEFWRPVAVNAQLEGVFFSRPGLGAEPPQPDINGIDDLAALVAKEIIEPVNIVAQSMGGVIAMKLALLFPSLINRLVLAVTSGGVPVADLGGSEWRPNYSAVFPNAAKWIAGPVADLSSQIPAITAPTLLLWGGADPISPVAVGERLRSLLPNARLCVYPNAGHDLAQSHADMVAIEVRYHLMAAK